MSVMLDEAERVLRTHSPVTFDTTIDAFPECIEFVRAVEDEEAWKARYNSLEAFYAAHEKRHPDVRLYGRARRMIATADPPKWKGGMGTKLLEQLRRPDVDQ